MWCLSLLLSVDSMAETHQPVELQLAQDPQWLALLHMRPLWPGRLSSQADEPSFFISGKKDDPVAELEATIDALKQSDSTDRSAWCVFPARAAWLQQHVDLQPPVGLFCPSLDRWRQQFDVGRLVLVFPDMYAQNPASLFGHTLFRFDNGDQDRQPVLLSTALSYYAAVGSSGGTVNYILKGLSGGFDGIFEVRPYFEKIRKYSDNEDRDIHEYELALDAKQIRMLIDHMWEVRGHTFNYFFLDENCSYRLVALLDAVTAPHVMRFQFPLDAMPLDTIKVLNEHGLVRATAFVPSATKLFRQGYGDLTSRQQAVVDDWLAGSVSSDQLQHDARVRDAAMQYAGIRVQQGGVEAVQYQQALQEFWQQTVSESSVSAKGRSVVAVAPSEPDPVNVSHGTRRVGVEWLHADGDAAMRMGVRMAYHDELDPLPGFDAGFHLEALDVRWQWSGDDVSLDRITWFGMKSRKPRDKYFQPVSWGMEATRRRELLGDNWSLVNAVDAERGVAYRCAAWLCHAEGIATVIWGGQVDQEMAMGAGARVGVLYQSQDWSVDVSVARLQYLQGEHGGLNDYVFAVNRRLQRDVSVGVQAARRDNGGNAREELSVGVRYFF